MKAIYDKIESLEKIITILPVIAYNTSRGVIRLLLRVIALEYLLQRL